MEPQIVGSIQPFSFCTRFSLHRSLKQEFSKFILENCVVGIVYGGATTR